MIESEYEIVSAGDVKGQRSVIVTKVTIIRILVAFVSCDFDGH